MEDQHAQYSEYCGKKVTVQSGTCRHPIIATGTLERESREALHLKKGTYYVRGNGEYTPFTPFETLSVPKRSLAVIVEEKG